MLGFSFAKSALTRDNSSLHVVATEKVVSAKAITMPRKAANTHASLVRLAGASTALIGSRHGTRWMYSSRHIPTQLPFQETQVPNHYCECCANMTYSFPHLYLIRLPLERVLPK